jgi:YVTN family beta-propeller protein
MELKRRDFLQLAAASAAGALLNPREAAAQAGRPRSIEPYDRVFIANEDSNTLSVIDPRSNSVDTTINLTSFDEDPRPPFRFVTGGVMPPHAAMIHKPLYHGCIDAHGCVPSPDGRMLATAGRGSSNVYLIDTINKKVFGNTPNPAAGPTTNAERITSGYFVGREPHEPTFTRDGRELWVAVRGEDRIAIADMERSAPIRYLDTLNGPAQVWFSADGAIAFVASQKVARLDVFRRGTEPRRIASLDLSGEDKPGFTPFLKTSPDGREVWLSHKLADALSARSTAEPFGLLDLVPLGNLARPNHVEFVENGKGRVVYASLARVDDGGPGNVASSRIAIIDRAAPAGQRKVVGTFFSRGREAHGMWTNPANDLLYIAHEQDELPGTPGAGQTVCTAFDVSDPFNPRFLAQVTLGSLKLPSGELRNKKSINLVYVRPGYRGKTA